MNTDLTKGFSIDLMTNLNNVIVSMGYDSITTNITLAAGYGAILPDPSFSGSYDLAWWNASDYQNPIDDPFVEIVKCIAKVGDTLIVIRSQQQTLSSSKNIPGKLYKMVILPDGRLESLSYYNIPQVHDDTKHIGNAKRNTVNGVAALDGTRELPHHIKKVASENLRNSHDAQINTTAGVYTKLKTITFNNGLIGQVRAKVDGLRQSGGLGYVKFYKNGVAIGAEHEVGPTYVTYSDDLTTDFAPGDTLEVWAYHTGGYNTYVRNFRVYYDDSPTVAVTSTNS